jgi:hypothetical protein
MVPANELLAMQQEAQKSLDQVCAIERNSPTPDGAGQSVDNWQILAGQSAIPCTLAEPTGSYMQNLAAKISNLATWQVSLPVGTIVARGDHLVVGSDTLLVQHVLDPHSYPVLLRVLASEVR